MRVESQRTAPGTTLGARGVEVMRDMGALCCALGVVLALLMTDPSSAANSQCSNNLKQIGLALHAFPDIGRTGLTPRTTHTCEICTDGTSTTILITEKAGESRSVEARLEGCPPDIATQGFGANPRITSRRTDFGGLELRIFSPNHRHCEAVALLLPAIQKVREATNRPPARTAQEARIVRHGNPILATADTPIGPVRLELYQTPGGGYRLMRHGPGGSFGANLPPSQDCQAKTQCGDGGEISCSVKGSGSCGSVGGRSVTCTTDLEDGSTSVKHAECDA